MAARNRQGSGSGKRNGLPVMDCDPFQEGSSAAINHVRLEATLIHLCRWQHPEADAPEELPGWGKLLPSPEPPPRGVGHGAGLGPAGQGAQGALVPCSIRGTKSINAGEAAAHTPGRSSTPTQGSWCNLGWLRSAPRRPGPAGAGQSEPSRPPEPPCSGC